MGKNNYKRGVAVIVLVSILSGIILFFVLSKNVNAKEFTILLPSQSEHILYSYIWLAKEKGFFAEEGLDVEISVNDDASIPAQVSFDPEIQIGVMNIESLFEEDNYVQYLTPFDFFLYGSSATSSYDTHLVVSKNSGITTVSELKGKKIRTGFPPTIIALKKILNEVGLNYDDIVPVSGNEIRSHEVLDKIRSGDLDGAITYFPTMPVMIASGDVEILKENIFNEYVNHHVPQSFIGINKNFAKENPITVHKFLRAMEKAYVYGNENPAELITSYVKLKTFSDASWILDDSLIQKGAALIPEIPIRDLDDKIFMEELGISETVYEHLIEYQDILYDEGLIDIKVDLQGLLNNYIEFRSSN